MKKSFLFIGFTLFSTLLFATLVKASIVRTLRFGSTGTDVKELQILLNKDPETRIALVGAGSPGKETSSFGALTKQAVIRFQTKYAGEVLYPAGISFPTGVVGEMTRAKLNKLYPSQASTPSTTTPIVLATPPPHIDTVSPNVVSLNAQAITITGTNFSPNGNSIVIASDSDRAIGSYSSSDGKTITIAFTHSVIDKVRGQLSIYKGTANYQSILSSFVANLTGENISTENGTTYLRAILLVRNSGGDSNGVAIKVDIKSFLQ